MPADAVPSRGRLLVIRPDPLDDLDRYAGWFAECGLTLRVVKPYAGEEVPDRLDEDGLVVLGGDMNAWDDDEYPWLVDICHLLTTAVSAGHPVLGICLGGQLLARAHGGLIERGDAGEEAGVVSVRWRKEAETDPVFGGLPDAFVAGAMHRDMITELPPDAVWLGQNDTYRHQAFRVGVCGWGVQFHPEVSAGLYETWADVAARAENADAETLERSVKEFRQLDDDVATSTQALAERFAAVVIEHAAQRLAG